MRKIEFGWPLPKRQDHFQQLSKDPNARRYDAEIDFMEDRKIIPVWRISIDLPKYRILNGRTSSMQEEWLAKNPGQPKDFFSGDTEREELQKVQHDILKQLIEEKNLLPFFQNPTNKQKDYLILDCLGYVINGNRRLCAWRELLSKEPEKYKHFEHIDVIVLPKSDDKAIDILEGEIQVKPDIQADYAWHALANMMMIRMKLHGLDEKAISKIYAMRETKVRQLIDMRNYAAEYLRERGKEGCWSEVVKTELSFEAMVEKRKQISGTGEKRLFEVGAFALLDDPKGGRLYEYIPDLYKYRDAVRERLTQEFPIILPAKTGNDPLGIDLKEVQNHLIAKEIDKPTNRSRATEIIKDVIETQDLLNKEKDSTMFIYKQLQKANAAIQAAITGIHRNDINRSGIPDTIKSIEGGINVINGWLKNDR